jgi:hypothetical protein
VAKFDIDVRPTAQQDLKNIHDWISERASPAIALAYIRKIQSSYMSLSDFPSAARAAIIWCVACGPMESIDASPSPFASAAGRSRFSAFSMVAATSRAL